MIRAWPIALLAAMVPLAPPALASDVKVRVSGVSTDTGDMRVQICTPETFLQDCPYKAKLPARRGVTEVIVRNVPEGDYAVLAHHDINANGKMDRTFIGIPKEGIGFSRDPLLSVRAPTFAETAVPVHGALVEVDIGLKFEPSP